MPDESKSALMSAVLAELLAQVPEVRGVVIASADGLGVAQQLRDGEDSDQLGRHLARLTALAAKAARSGGQISQAVSNGEFQEWSISASAAHVFVYAAGQKGTLALLARPSVNPLLLHDHARDAALAISLLL